MYFNSKPKRIIVSTEEAHANALTLEEEVEVEWIVDWESERRRMVCKNILRLGVEQLKRDISRYKSRERTKWRRERLKRC